MAVTNLSDLFAVNRLELLFSGQTNWNTVLSANTASLNLILPFLKRVVESVLLTAPPVVAPGTCPLYLVAVNSTGAWVGHDREFAVYDPDAEKWLFFTPFEGYMFYCKADKKAYMMIPESTYFIPALV